MTRARGGLAPTVSRASAGRKVLVAAAVCVALGAVSLTQARQAHAQGAGGGISNEMRAEYLFRSGEKKFDSGKHAQACADFAESLRLGPKLGTLLNLALCHEMVGKPATAWSEFHHASAWAAQNGQKDRHDFALQHALALETKLPRVLLQLPADRAIGAVEVDGEPLPDARWYLPVFLDPGEHSVTLSAPGKQRSTVKFRVISSPTEQLVAVPALIDEVAAPSPALASGAALPAGDPDHTRRMAGLVTLGAGGVGVALGLTFGILAIHERNAIGNRCAGDVCTPEGAELYRDAQSSAAIATVSTALGLAAGAVGGWLYLTSRPGAPAPPRVGVVPRAGGAELGLGGVF